MRVKEIQGGVTSAKGFRAAGVHGGIKADAGALDLGILCSDAPASAAGVFTRNRVKGEPVLLSQARVARGTARAVVANSGCSNVCTGTQGAADAVEMTRLTASKLGLPEEDVLVCSTGVIGRHLPMDAVRRGIASAAAGLGASAAHGNAFARAILTTDLGPKEAAASFSFGKRSAVIGGCIKGAGMIAPDMATMLCFLTTDAAVAPAPLQQALRQAVARTLNRITVDGHMSTSDTTLLFANGQCGERRLEASSGPDYDALLDALVDVLGRLGEQLVAGAEGVTRTATVTVEDAPSEAEAERIARAIANSPLVKTALNGGDPNWGRIVSMAGAASDVFDPAKARLWIGAHEVFSRGEPSDVPAATVAAVMRQKDVPMRLSLGLGTAKATLLTCDLSKEYVSINADYTT
jgi:glutamate N-acetyltransferase/amino-acid N-acetyltransferase